MRVSNGQISPFCLTIFILPKSLQVLSKRFELFKISYLELARAFQTAHYEQLYTSWWIKLNGIL